MTLCLPSWARRALQLAFTLALTWFILTRVGVTLDEALAAHESIADLRFGWLFASTLLLLGGFLLVARSWGWMISDLGGSDPGGGASMRIVLLANLARYIPGKLWQIAGLAYLGRRAGIPATLATASGVLGQLFALAAAGIVALPALLRGGALPGDTRWGTIFVPVLLLLLLAVSVPAVLRRTLRAIFRIAGLQGEDVPEGRVSFGPRWLGWHLLIWSIYGAAFLLLLRGLGTQGDEVFFASAFAAAYLLGYLVPFAPAGVGVREGVLVALLRPEVGGSAVAIALIARLWMTAVELLPAGFLALLPNIAEKGEGAA